MILSEKIVRLRKQVGWSQEDLAEKLDVSRQSVSKWESANSIPDLNKIILLAGLFGVSTDYLLKDDIEPTDPINNNHLETNTVQVSLEQAITYVKCKIDMAKLVAKGILLCIGSPIPLLALIALAKGGQVDLDIRLAVAAGIALILMLVAIGISFFVRTNQYESDTSTIDEDTYELAYGVKGAINEKLGTSRPQYNLKLTIGIALFIFSAAPLLVSSMLYSSSSVVLMTLIMTIAMVALGLFIIIPVSAEYEAYRKILQDSQSNSAKSQRIKRAEKFAAFYWPLVTAIFIGWSLWTMNWGVTWIIWPVSAVLFVALLGLMELFNKDEAKA